MSLRLFTLARVGMFPITMLEAIMYLVYNTKDCWGMAEVKEALDMSMEELREMFKEITALHDEADPRDEMDNEYEEY